MHIYNNNNLPYEHNHIFVVLAHSADNAHVADTSNSHLGNYLRMNSLHIVHARFEIHLYKNIFQLSHIKAYPSPLCFLFHILYHFFYYN